MTHAICLYNGKIYERQGLQNATALIIDQGVIRYVGDDAGAHGFILGDTEKIDVGGRIIFPGFTDTHLHLSEWARRKEHLDLNPFASLKDTCDHIRENAQDKEWLIGGGWNQNAWTEKRFPHRKDLDFLGPDVKAVFYSKDFHSAWVNAPVIELFDFNDVLRMLQKGYVKRESDGQLSGLLHEEALSVLLDPLLKTRPPGIFDDPATYFRDFYRHGITSLHSMEHFEDYKKYLSLYQYEHQRGPRLGIYIYHTDKDKVFAQNMEHGRGGPRLRFLGLKIFVDGALGSQTAWLRKPYESGEHYGKKQVHGEELRQAIAGTEGHGCALSIHALGDAAVEDLLDILDGFGRSLRVPLRVEHAQLLDEELIRRLKEHRIPLSVNPSHLLDDKMIAERHWGERSRMAYPYRSLKIAGIPYAFGSDAPVEDINPWKGIYAAVDRICGDDVSPWYPEECIRLSDAIDAYTKQGSLLTGCYEKKGILEPGYMGDCFVANTDVFAYPLEKWKNIRSLLTVIDGRIVYKDMDSS
ncbi:MAG: amidohydrolase [Candidatus Marinimicrobia bacterium]|nr:amidohydrolase [Candidatus Neomarinimicrobiota bacterium]